MLVGSSACKEDVGVSLVQLYDQDLSTTHLAPFSKICRSPSFRNGRSEAVYIYSRCVEETAPVSEYVLGRVQGATTYRFLMAAVNKRPTTIKIKHVTTS